MDQVQALAPVLFPPGHRGDRGDTQPTECQERKDDDDNIDKGHVRGESGMVGGEMGRHIHGMVTHRADGPATYTLYPYVYTMA